MKILILEFNQLFQVFYQNGIEKDSQEKKERTCFSRWFGKMEASSVRGSMLALTVTAIGGGILI